MLTVAAAVGLAILPTYIGAGSPDKAQAFTVPSLVEVQTDQSPTLRWTGGPDGRAHSLLLMDADGQVLQEVHGLHGQWPIPEKVIEDQGTTNLQWQVYAPGRDGEPVRSEISTLHITP